MKGKRFDITETEGGVKGLYVIVDKETGVNYLMAKFGITGGLCPLLDKDVMLFPWNVISIHLVHLLSYKKQSLWLCL